MAVQAKQCLSHAFYPQDLGHAFGAVGGGGGMLLDALGAAGGCTGGIEDAVFGCEAQQRSGLTCNGNDVGRFLPRKRARVAPAPGLQLQEGGGTRGLALPLPIPEGQVFGGGDRQSRAGGCGAASTSGRVAVGGFSQAIISYLCSQDVEIDALVRLETERIRFGLQEASQRQLRAMMVAADRATGGRLRAVEAELERARCRNAELEERFRQMVAEAQAWMGVAQSHEAVAGSLRATLHQLLLQQQQLAGDAEDAQSCCFETAGVADGCDAESGGAPSCKSCRGAQACVLLLPCRHLCLCRACEAVATSCPVCAATVNGSLQVLLS